VTLLEQAKAVPCVRGRRLDCDDDTIELAVAYAAGGVTATQAAVALRTTHSEAVQKLARALREGVKRGLVTRPAMRSGTRAVRP
jgi:hypothetical protein